MRVFARELGYGDEEEFWGIAGLLHDLDFERFPEEHCKKSQEIMAQRGLSPELIHATTSHGYGITVDIRPEHEMEKVLYATDELTGLTQAAALMRPSRSVMDMELKSLKKNIRAPPLPPAVPGGHCPGRGDAGMEPGRSFAENPAGNAGGRSPHCRPGGGRIPRGGIGRSLSSLR